MREQTKKRRLHEAGRGDNSSAGGSYLWFALAAMTIIVVGYSFDESLKSIAAQWSTQEYSHGYLVPAISLWLAWHRRAELARLGFSGDWTGVAIVLLALSLNLLGELSGQMSITHFALLLNLAGLVVTVFGWPGLRVVWAPIVFLIFMIPIPEILRSSLSLELQLLSSSWGVAIIRLFGISVYLDGNIIDLGTHKLQVVEACSGLRYLIPMMSIGFISAYLTRFATWKKIILFASTVPLTIIMNSLRIGLVGILVEYRGIGFAQGFYHQFEGWVIFIACIVILFCEAWLLASLSGRSKSGHERPMLDLHLRRTPESVSAAIARPRPPAAAFISIALMLLISVGINFLAVDRAEAIQRGVDLSSFPLNFDEWKGQRTYVKGPFVASLRPDDFIAADYGRGDDDESVNLFIAYSARQSGLPSFSPQICLPAHGWSIESAEDKIVRLGGSTPDGLKVKSVIIRKGEERRLVYYWFQHRGRHLVNRYEAAWYMFWDGLVQNRTDGSMVRLITVIENPDDWSEAEARLLDFLEHLEPTLGIFLPS